MTGVKRMEYQTLRLKREKLAVRLQIYRPEASNSINGCLIDEMLVVMRELEQDTSVKVVALEGLPEVFCTGMDFDEVARDIRAARLEHFDPDAYFSLLKLFSQTSKVVVSLIEGKVNAGGIGFVASSDLAIASEKAVFSLSEALFGLLPACVLPFLVRRTGFQKAHWLTLTTQSISAKRAYEIGLVDEYGDVQDLFRRYLLRISRLEPRTVQNLKAYMNTLWEIGTETQQRAVDRITSLVHDPEVQGNIQHYVAEGVFPWAKR